MTSSLVGSEMCIRDRNYAVHAPLHLGLIRPPPQFFGVWGQGMERPAGEIGGVLRHMGLRFALRALRRAVLSVD
eukprot:2419010-Prorocentrum_lima.AAC.1